jgi:Aspartyl protease
MPGLAIDTPSIFCDSSSNCFRSFFNVKMGFSSMKRLEFALVIILWLFISPSADGQMENDTESLQNIDGRIRQYEQLMDRYFRQDPAITVQNSYKSAVDKYNALVQIINADENHRKSEIDNKRKALEKLEKQIGKYDAKLAEKSNNQLFDQRNALVKRYNRQLKKLENEITKFNQWVKQTNQTIDTEKAKLDRTHTASEQEIKDYNDWLRLNKDEEFWVALNRMFLNLHRKKRAGNNNILLDKLIQKIRSLRKELGTYAIKQANSQENGLVIIPGTIYRKEEFHFIVDTGANYVSLTPEMVEVLGLKERLGEVTGLKLAAGKTAWGRKIVFPNISVLGMKEQDVPGIAIPETKIGIDGLLGRSFLKRFVVCFDYEQGPKIQLTPKEP